MLSGTYRGPIRVQMNVVARAHVFGGCPSGGQECHGKWSVISQTAPMPDPGSDLRVVNLFPVTPHHNIQGTISILPTRSLTQSSLTHRSIILSGF